MSQLWSEDRHFISPNLAFIEIYATDMSRASGRREDLPRPPREFLRLHAGTGPVQGLSEKGSMAFPSSNLMSRC